MNLLVLVCGLLAAQPAGAESLQLVWQGPAACSDEAWVRREVERMLGAYASPSAQAPLLARVRIDPQGADSWRVTLATQQGQVQGQRQLTVSTCEEARHAVALVLALMLDPNAQVPRTAPEEPASASATAGPSPIVESPRDRELHLDRDRRQWSLAAGARVGSGVLPHWSAALALNVGWFREWFAVELEGTAWLPRSKASHQLDGAGGDFDLYGAALLSCGRSGRRFSFGACAGPGLRSMRGEGYGVSSPGAASAFWWVAEMQGDIELVLSAAFSLRLSATLEVPFQPPVFSVEGIGEVHRPQSAGLQLGLSLVTRF